MENVSTWLYLRIIFRKRKKMNEHLDIHKALCKKMRKCKCDYREKLFEA